MKLIRWTNHALKDLEIREINSKDVLETINEPQFIVPAKPPRDAYMRLYFDEILQKEMLMRVIIETTEIETVIITAYKTSQIEKYMKGLKP